MQFPGFFLPHDQLPSGGNLRLCVKGEDPEAKWAEVNVMKIGTFGTATTPVKCRVEVKDGVLDWKSAGLSLAVVFERYGKNGNIGYSLVEGALTKPALWPPRGPTTAITCLSWEQMRTI